MERRQAARRRSSPQQGVASLGRPSFFPRRTCAWALRGGSRLTSGSSRCVAWRQMEPPVWLGRHCAALALERDLDQQRGAAAGKTGDLERAAERFDSIADPTSPDPGRGRLPQCHRRGSPIARSRRARRGSQFLSRRTAGRRADNSSGRVTAALDDSLHRASPLCSQGRPRVAGD